LPFHKFAAHSFSNRISLSVITGFVNILENRVELGGIPLFHVRSQPFASFAEQWYRHHNVHYPKFHKMDPLCKLGLMGSDTLLNNNPLATNLDPYEVGVILSNRNSSLDTDLRHHHQSEKGPASPAVFVYSLPNIVIGEICIRHGIKGENTFFIEPEFNAKRQSEYIDVLFQTGTFKACIGGWVEFLNEKYRLFMYLVEETEKPGALPFNADTLTKLYHVPV
jgi:hypothetical protein